jgi:ABC-2 type transport system ATP-binding protein
VALSGCTLSIPGGHVVGLVGRNGAGKTTLLNLAVGLTAPTTGTIEVLGGTPTAGPAQLGRIGFLAQDSPVYPGLSVADHLRLGAQLARAGSTAWTWILARRPARCLAGSGPFCARPGRRLLLAARPPPNLTL